MKIHLWVPDFASATGGIQSISQFITRAAREIYPDASISVFSKNDTSYPDPNTACLDSFVPFGWWPERFRTAAFAASLFRAGIRERPNVIFTTHAHFTPAAIALKRFRAFQLIAIGYGTDVWDIGSANLKNALRRADRLLAISNFTRQKMAGELNIDSSAISLFWCTFDQEKFIPGPKPHFLLKRYNLRSDQPVILTIGRLAANEQYKGYDQALRALPAIKQRFPNVRYIIGGRGGDRPRIESLAKELGVGENVILSGFIPEHELVSHYNLCDVFAMPSKGEGFGIVFLEALSCGKPVIAGNKDGSVDAVLNGQLGLLVDPDSVDEIAAAIIAVIGGQPPMHEASASQGGQRTAVRAQTFATANPSFSGSEVRDQMVPRILHEPDALRRKVIEAYGYEGFVAQLKAVFSDGVTKHQAFANSDL
jgi:glycosyltransferase involved in cell wall biosynthesis